MRALAVATLLTIALVLGAAPAVADIVSVSPAQARIGEPVTVVIESNEGDSCLVFEPASLDYTTTDGPQPCGTGQWSVEVTVATIPDSGTMTIVEQVDGVEVSRLQIGVVEGSGTTTTTAAGDTTTTTSTTIAEETTTTTVVEETTTTEATTTTTTATTTEATTTTTAAATTTTLAPPDDTVVAGDDDTTGRDFPGGPVIPAALVAIGLGLMAWGGVFRAFRR